VRKNESQMENEFEVRVCVCERIGKTNLSFMRRGKGK